MDGAGVPVFLLVFLAALEAVLGQLPHLNLTEPLTLDRWATEHCPSKNSRWLIEYARWHNKHRHSSRGAKFLVYVRACLWGRACTLVCMIDVSWGTFLHPAVLCSLDLP